MKMSVAVGCMGTRREGVVSGGGSISVADVGGTGWKDCCRFPNDIFGELQEGLPCRLPFTLNIGEVCL